MATAGDRYEGRTGNIWSYANRGDMTGLKAAVIRGVDVNIANTVGWTACHAAAAGGQTKVLRYLVNKMNADLSITDKGGNRAVHHAAKNGHLHALRTLQELGADITTIRLSHAKGKAVRDFVAESYRKAGKKVSEDGEDEVEEAVGYARKQSKSTAFWGPRKTPISCAIKKKIIKDKRKIRKEKTKLKLQSSYESNEPEQEEEKGDEPSYQETVQQIKRRRKHKRRQQRAAQSQCKQQQLQKNEKSSMNPNCAVRQQILDEEEYTNNPEKIVQEDSDCDVNDNDDNNGDDDDDDNNRDCDDDSFGEDRLISSPITRFAALALIVDSDSE